MMKSNKVINEIEEVRKSTFKRLVENAKKRKQLLGYVRSEFGPLVMSAGRLTKAKRIVRS
jgi:hypothetical protein